jgi:hypothetical protein
MAERAALALIDNARRDTPRRGVEIIPGEIQVRESTGPAPA